MNYFVRISFADPSTGALTRTFEAETRAAAEAEARQWLLAGAKFSPVARVEVLDTEEERLRKAAALEAAKVERKEEEKRRRAEARKNLPRPKRKPKAKSSNRPGIPIIHGVSAPEEPDWDTRHALAEAGLL